MTITRSLLIIGSCVAMTSTLPAAAQVQVGPSGVGVGVGAPVSGRTATPTSRYAMPPAGMDPGSALAGVKIEDASLDEIADVIKDIERGLGDCRSTGRRLDLEMSTTRDPSAVHPDWIRQYQECLQQQEEDIDDVQEVLSNRLNGGVSEKAEAQRIENLVARLGELEEELDDAFFEQQQLVSDYNFGR